LLYFLLLLDVNSTKSVVASRNQMCWENLQQSLRLTRLVNTETKTLFKEYKTYQGEAFQEGFCKAQGIRIPDPTISGLETSERIASIYTHIQAFLPHLKRVQEQQTDLQPPESPLLKKFTIVEDNSRRLAYCIENFYHSSFPNLSLPEPASGPTTLPPPQNVFQQKVYGCAVLKTYKKLLTNIINEQRTLKSRLRRPMDPIYGI
uniref:Ciliary neurotrophic factor n=1 Tax=Nothobranchius furzeri TaxID=105023 RepID=A0A8C6PJE1_NOTFU